jgi:hypothetical protein
LVIDNLVVNYGLLAREVFPDVSVGGLVWGVTTMAAISGLVLTLIPWLV